MSGLLHVSHTYVINPSAKLLFFLFLFGAYLVHRTLKKRFFEPGVAVRSSLEFKFSDEFSLMFIVRE
jgi:hypothetical protein